MKKIILIILVLLVSYDNVIARRILYEKHRKE